MTLLQVYDLSFSARTREGMKPIVRQVSLHLDAGETLGIVGESGCGKTTLARTVLRLNEPSGGRILFDGQDLTQLSAHALRGFRRRAQMVFQDPYSALNPRHSVRRILTAPLALHEGGARAGHEKKARDMIARVGLGADALDLLPHQFSGGQRQRIVIARALILRPSVVICDEPVAALDLTIQAQIINLLNEMKREFGLSYIVISHDLAVIRYISDRVAVMYRGRIVESAPVASLWQTPLHPYSRLLMEAIPSARHRRSAPAEIEKPPVSGKEEAGCPYRVRCPLASVRCTAEDPPLRLRGTGHFVACHHVGAAG